MQNKTSTALMRSAAIACNILFVLWMTFNALKEGFSGTIYEKISYAGLICLLALNSYLVLGGARQAKTIKQ
jgi:hypothetical protein